MQIHWHEGLFLQPHHFQRLQRFTQELIHQDRRLTWSYPFGVVESRLSPDELANFRLRFDYLRVIMPNGVEICFPDNADLPSLDLKPILSSSAGGVTIFLGLPLWQEKRANTIDATRPLDARARLLFRVDEVSIADENTGDNPKAVQVRRLNARFVTEHEEKSDLDLLPLIRVVLGTGEQVGLPRADPEFVPPSLFLRSSLPLYQMVRDLVNQLEASRKELALQISRGGFSMEALRGPQLEQIMRLRTLNRFAARLPTLIEAPSVPPLAWYLELRELLAELAALRPDSDDFGAPAYNHSNLYYPFDALTQKIRGLLRNTSKTYDKVDFRNEQGLHVATFTEEQLNVPTDYFLAIKTRQEYRTVLALVEDGNKFKLLPRSMANAAVFGVKLKEERVPPVQLPAQSDLHYFRVLRADSARVWQKLQLEKAAVLRWPGQEASDFQVTLYMTLPS